MTYYKTSVMSRTSSHDNDGFARAVEKHYAIKASTKLTPGEKKNKQKN